MGDIAQVENEFQPIVDISTMTEEDVARARQIADGIDVNDSQAIIQYGVGAQKNIAGFSDTILSEIRNKDSGYVGEALSSLVGKIKEVDVDSVTDDQGALGKLFGGLKAKLRKLMSRYQKLETQIDTVVAELDKARMNLLRDLSMLDGLYKKNIEFLRDLDVFIAAGQLKIEEIRTQVLPKLREQAEKTGDPMDAQRVQDLAQMLNRFEKKLYDMKLSRMISIQTSPQIRLIQNNNQTLIEKIQSSIMNTIPLWKSQIVIAISLYRQKKALEVQRQVTDATNDLLLKNSEMLKDSSIEVAKESERGIVEIETLKKVNADLISTLDETMKIQEEGRRKRQAAEQELAGMEKDLKAKLTEITA